MLGEAMAAGAAAAIGINENAGIDYLVRTYSMTLNRRLFAVMFATLFALFTSSGYARDGHWGSHPRAPHSGKAYGSGNAYYGGKPHYYRSGGWGVSIGFPLYWPSYTYWPYYSYPPYYYSPPLVAAPATPPVYIEQGSDSPMPPADATAWNYCPASKSYYPHVKQCPSGWQRIAPQPLGQEPGYWYYCDKPAGYYPYVIECQGIWKQLAP